MNYSRIIANHLLNIKAIIVNVREPFTWASGLKSPIYCDNRMLLSYPYIRHDLLDAFVEEVNAFEHFSCVAGVATAGIAHGALLADRLGLPFIYVRSKSKGHGRQNLIEGKVTPNASVLVVEDLISTGGSSLAAADALEEQSMHVCGVLSIFTYQLDRAHEAIASKDYPVRSISTLESLIEVAQERQLIDEDDMQSLLEWRKDPASWSARQQ
ncbi:MAG: orotate phosphoribosyltransferase [Saprospiraceae bacterium]|nr:orotate phosphoribosyltransferase [Saprospiraceae bacterium]